jgi:hypothetical protein
MKQKEAIERTMENFIHRLVFTRVCTYEQAFDCLPTGMCENMQESYREMNKGKTNGKHTTNDK